MFEVLVHHRLLLVLLRISTLSNSIISSFMKRDPEISIFRVPIDWLDNIVIFYIKMFLYTIAILSDFRFLT